MVALAALLALPGVAGAYLPPGFVGISPQNPLGHKDFELMEEAGLKVGHVAYHTTQPWPFPSSLMIGCYAEAESRDTKVDETEIAEVRWLERDLARRLVKGEGVDGVWVPPAIAIAHHLIKDWAEK